MELHLSDHNLCLPSLFSITDSDIPSFEEAFDTESLRKFYRQKDPSVYSLKEFSVEEDTRSQTLDSLSPTTPAHSNSFMEYFQAGGKESWQDLFGRSNQAVDKVTSEPLFCQRSKSQGQGLTGVKSAKKQQKSKEEDTEKNLIAKLCMEMQEYYSSSAPKGKTEEVVTRQAQQQQQMAAKGKKSSPEKKTFYNKKEEELNNKVIKRLIQKKSIFKVQRKKGYQAPQVESPVEQNNFNFVQQQFTPQNNKIAVEFMTQALPVNTPVYPAVGYQENFLNQERRQPISFQIAPNMNFNMGNGYYNRGNIRVSNMNINMAHYPY